MDFGTVVAALCSMGVLCFVTWPTEVLLLLLKFLDLHSFIRLKIGHRLLSFKDTIGFYQLCTGYLNRNNDYSFVTFLPHFFGCSKAKSAPQEFIRFLNRLTAFKIFVVRENYLHMALRLTRVESLIIVLWSLSPVDTFEEVLAVEPYLRFVVYWGKSICLLLSLIHI